MHFGLALIIFAAAVIAIAPVVALAADEKPAAAKQPSKDSKDAKGSDAAANESPKPAPPAKPQIKLPPLKGSHLKEDDNSCFQCHTNSDLWDAKDKVQYKFYLPLDSLKKDVHFQKGINCSDCHGGDPAILEPKAHQTDDFRFKLADVQPFCARCHQSEVTALSTGAAQERKLPPMPRHARRPGQGLSARADCRWHEGEANRPGGILRRLPFR